jgi:hypothetical protein
MTHKSGIIYTVKAANKKQVVLCTRNKHGVTEYLIKWQGFDTSYASWEQEKNLSEGLLRAYRNRERSGKYRISGASASATPSFRASEVTIFQLKGNFNTALNSRLGQYLSNGWYTNGIGFNG